MRPVALEITLPSGHVEAFTKRQLEELLESGRTLMQSQYPPAPMERLIDLAASICKTTRAAMRSKARPDNVAFARWLVWHHVYNHGATLEKCGALFNRDHSVVHHGLVQIRLVATHGKPWQKTALDEFKKRAAEIGNPLQ